MREAGLVVARTLQRVAAAVQPGVTTGALDALAEQSIRDEGAVPSFLGYHGFSGSICASAGAEVVHGVPSADAGRCARASCCRSTAGPSSPAGTATRP